MTAPAERGNLRQHARSAIELPVVVSDAENRVEGAITFDTQDVSVGGAFIRSDLLFEIGEELQLAINLPSGRTVRAIGRVVRVARDTGDEGAAPGMGVQFSRLSDTDREAIQALVTRGRED
jgi:c-di-GMP-binding flagellar brake protein YcgR